MRRLQLLAVVATLSLTSCFKDEPLNAEADIERVSVHIESPLSYFFNLSDTAQNVSASDSVITFSVRNNVDLTAMAPEFQLTPGATINPISGSVLDFSNGPQFYTVTSEDRQWKRIYKLVFQPTTVIVRDTLHFNFENYSLEPREQKYYTWQEIDEDGQAYTPWATGNPGFNLSMGSAEPDEYPTYPVTEGHTGACAALTTRSTGAFGAMANRRIAAGNLFLGTFDLSVALTNTLHATCFGQPFSRRPTVFKGWYKYTPGPTYQDYYGKEVSDKTDCGAIYAVLYRNHDDEGNKIVLYGDNAKTSEQVVAIADFGDVSATDGWQQFTLTFNYLQDVDLSLLESQGYNLAIVFSSSNEGEKFEGAIGSTLLIDDVEIICATQE